MQIGEVGLLTNDVNRLADFYKFLLRVDNGSRDPVHQTILGEEPTLTVYNDGSEKSGANQRICLAFTVDDVDEEYRRLLNWGAAVLDSPATQPWGARNMRLLDPDGNQVYLRQLPRREE